MLGLFLLIFLFLEFYAESHLKNYLPDQFKQQYNLEYDDFEIHYLDVGFGITNLKISPDSSGQGAIKQLEVPHLEVSGVNLWGLVFQNLLKIDQISVDQPLLALTSNKKKKASQSDQTGKQRSKGLKLFHLDAIKLNQGKITYYKQNSDSLLGQIPELTINGEQLKYQLQDSSNQYQVGNLKVLLYDPWIETRNGLYRLEAKQFSASYQDGLVNLDSFEINPLLPRFDFSRKVGHQMDRFEGKVGKIEALGVDFDRMMETSELDIQQVVINLLDLDIFRDRRLPAPGGNKKLPSKLLADLKIKFQIDSVNLKNSKIRYFEFVEGGHDPGKLSFEKMDVSLKHLTTLDSGTSSSTIMAKAFLMGAAELNAEFNYPGGFQQDTFTVSGKLNNMDLSQLNPMTSDVAFMAVKSGINHNMTFNFEANSKYSQGKMQFYYDDLNVQLLNKDAERSPGLIKESLSTFINSFVIKKNNPANGQFRVGQIYFNRAENGEKFIFNYWWKTLLSGIKDSVGVKKS